MRRRKSGKLNVVARGGACNITVDGIFHGPTPIAGIIVSAGAHTVMCAVDGGRIQTASVSVKADDTARFSFALP